MNIEEQRKAFEEIFTSSKGWDLTCINGVYQNQNTNNAYAGWKASARRQGYKLVPLEPTDRMLDSAYSSISDNLHYADLENIYKAMIGAVNEST